ncbi:antibiotic biosynthesis monooxygenase [Lichenifustis flavocetrariae]|uniref:Antibiotic biosynthesis monooxygenase n=1 Tax=Lichenifustis flavocetrariae TaxID=2949735 RepID=A0AA41YWQ4_9HYPH|nr:antibiotic biosynthesis monooxygenase [Lichenifustis flavocetrariae]MCW6509989.1 antibiotic biosynthesis monooxygenase [Lichenifustis flavocetrariae]
MYSPGAIQAADRRTPGAEQSAPNVVKPGVTKAVATKLSLRPGMETPFATWQAAFTRAASAAPDFVSLEIIPAFPGAVDWQVIQRFSSPEGLSRWVSDAGRAALLAELAAIEGSGQGSHPDEAAPDFHSTTTVTEVFATVVKPGQEHAFRLWSERIQQEQARFPGYMGTLVQAPLSLDVPYWTTLVRFEAPAFLDAWLQSSERKAILTEATPEVSSWENHRMTNAFAGWFANEQHLAPPPAWKQTCLVLLVLFPIVMLEIRFLSPLLSGLPLALSTFIGNAISVSVVSWPLMAVAIFGLGWWLRPPAHHRRRTELLGLSTLAALYALELLIFTYLM